MWSVRHHGRSMTRLRWTSFRRVFSSLIIYICNSKCSCLTHITTTQVKQVKNRPTTRKREKVRILLHICTTANISSSCPAKCFPNLKRITNSRRWHRTLDKYTDLGSSWKTLSPTIQNLPVSVVLDLAQTRSQTRAVVDLEEWRHQVT